MRAQAPSVVTCSPQHLGEMNHAGVDFRRNKKRLELKGQIRTEHLKKKGYFIEIMSASRGKALGEELHSPKEVPSDLPRFQKGESSTLRNFRKVAFFSLNFDQPVEPPKNPPQHVSNINLRSAWPQFFSDSLGAVRTPFKGCSPPTYG